MRSSALALLARLVVSIGNSRASANKCFADRAELRDAIESYLQDESCTSPPPASVAPRHLGPPGAQGRAASDAAGGLQERLWDEEIVGDDGCEVGRTYGWPMGEWCVSDVTNMTDLFYESRESSNKDLAKRFEYFNEDLAKWDTSKVTSMHGMFRNAAHFNGNLGFWDTSRVVDMRDMFNRASFFMGDVSSWNTSNVIDMHYMFYGTIDFMGDVSQWDTSKVTTMRYMFAQTVMFNADISSWNISSVAEIRGMFFDAGRFNQDLCAWNTTFPYVPARPSQNWNLTRSWNIFLGSGCAFTSDPQEEFGGPFCASSCRTLSPTPVPDSAAVAARGKGAIVAAATTLAGFAALTNA